MVFRMLFVAMIYPPIPIRHDLLSLVYQISVKKTDCILYDLLTQILLPFISIKHLCKKRVSLGGNALLKAHATLCLG